MNRQELSLDLELEQALAAGVEEIKGHWGDRNGKIFPSDLGIVVDDGGCPRAFWHKLRNAPTKTPSVHRQLTMMTGDYLEQMVIDVLTRILPTRGYRVVATQRFVEVPGTTGGKLDILIENLETGEREVVEVKVTNEKSIKFLPKPAHMLQLQSYMRGEGAERGHLVYLFREMNEAPQVFKVRRDDEKVERAGEEIVALAEGPEPPPTKKAWQTRFCDLETCQCKGRS